MENFLITYPFYLIDKYITKSLDKILPQLFFNLFTYTLAFLFELWTSIIIYLFNKNSIIKINAKKKTIYLKFKVNKYIKSYENINKFVNNSTLQIDKSIIECDIPTDLNIDLYYVAPGYISIGKYDMFHYFQYEPMVYRYKISNGKIETSSMMAKIDRYYDLIYNKNINNTISIYDDNYRYSDNIRRIYYLLAKNLEPTLNVILNNIFEKHYYLVKTVS